MPRAQHVQLGDASRHENCRSGKPPIRITLTDLLSRHPSQGMTESTEMKPKGVR